MAFRVQSIRTGEYFTFSAKEILHLIGDSINDEINLDGEVYRISTCEELVSGNGAIANIDWQADTLEINSNGETVFYFPAQVSDTQSLFLTVNNVLYSYGVDADFHVQDNRLYWHGQFQLETDDNMVVRYPLNIN